MPRILPYTSQVDPYAKAPGRRATAQDFGAGIGAAVAGVGQTIGAVAEEFRRREEERDVLEVRNELAKARADWTVRLKEAADSAEPGTPIADAFARDWDTFVTEARDKLPKTDAGAREFLRVTGLMRADFLERAAVFQSESAAAKAVGDFAARLDADRNTLLTDPTQFSRVMSEAIEDLKNPKGPFAQIPAAKRLELARATEKEMAQSAVLGTIRSLNAPELAEKQLQSGQWDQALDADTKAALLKEADVAKRAMEAEAERRRALEERAKRDEQEATMQGFLQKATKGELSNAEIMRSGLSVAQKEHFLQINQRRAYDLALTRPKPSDPRTVDQLQRRLFAAEGDPSKIDDPLPIEQAYRDGRIDYDDMLRLRRQLVENQRPEINSFNRDMQSAAGSAHRMFLASPLGRALPEQAEEAYYRWRRDLEAAIDQDRKDGRDPRERLDPRSKTYALAPEFLATYAKSAQSAIGEQADALRTGANLKPGDVVERAGQFWRFKGGDPATPEAWEPANTMTGKVAR